MMNQLKYCPSTIVFVRSIDTPLSAIVEKKRVDIPPLDVCYGLVLSGNKTEYEVKWHRNPPGQSFIATVHEDDIVDYFDLPGRATQEEWVATQMGKKAGKSLWNF